MDRPKLIIFNVYFTPNSFGGATIVAENMAQLLQRDHGWDVVVVTTIKDPKIVPYSVIRYESKGISIIAINVPNTLSYEEFYKNEKITTIVGDVVAQVKPDMAHIHSVQTMGADMITELKKANVPVAVTVHDCWWICERQFMINNHGQYCFQKKIDSNICSHCVDDISRSNQRVEYLRSELEKSDLILFPSEFHKDLFVENGFSVEKCVVNKNGVLPAGPRFGKSIPKNTNHRVRFGFTGGPGPIKGLKLIEESFNEIDSDQYELILVDAAQNINASWRRGLGIDIQGTLSIVPAYSQDTMDDFFSNIDVLLFPSQWKESFGLTVREALIRDVWVIATDAGGPAEDCVDGENASLIPLTSDIRYLTKAIEECMTKPWKGFNNPHKNALQTINSQAAELSDTLREILN